MNEQKEMKELNLLQLLSIFFQWIKRTFINLINIAGKSLQLLYSYKWVTIFVMILSLAAGLYLSRPSAKKYKAEAMAIIHGSEAQTVKEICKQLEQTIATNDNLSLTTKMGLPDSISKNIISIRTFDVIDYLADGTADKIDFKQSHSLDDTLNVKMRDRVYIQIRTRNISQVPVFQEYLKKYFSANPILASQFEAQKNSFLDQIKICDAELQRIDSLAKVMYFKNANDEIKFENNKLFVGENRKQLFYGELLEINSRKGWAENKLAECVSPVDFPSNFVVIANPVNNRLKYTVLALVGGVVLSLLLALFLSNLRKIINYLENK
jgi:hypothetical protein